MTAPSRWGFATKFIAACALSAWALAGFCQKLEVRDNAGSPVSLQKPARRIVTLAPNLAELVFAAGAGDRLVAVSRYSDFPEPVKKLPVISDAFAINFEALAGLKPDLVLVWQSGIPERQRSALKALAARQGFAVFESEIRSVDGIADTLRSLGQLAGSAAVAEPEAARVLSDWHQLQSRYRGAAPVRVFYQLWDQPLMTYNGQHIVSLALRSCGGVGGFDALTALTPTVSREAVLAFNPQLILAGGDQPVPPSLAAWRRLPQLDAVRHGQLKAANAAVLSRMGPRFVEAAAELCGTIAATRKALKP
jgi:iron complex transport system substrate-binding protein